jgi:hypothetical protein
MEAREDCLENRQTDIPPEEKASGRENNHGTEVPTQPCRRFPEAEAKQPLFDLWYKAQRSVRSLEVKQRPFDLWHEMRAESARLPEEKASGQESNHGTEEPTQPHRCPPEMEGKRKLTEIWHRAEDGEIRAQWRLARLYHSGRLLPKDDEKAFYWWLRAAQQGDAASQCACGHCYDWGIGVRRDLDEAMNWFYKSAQQGYAPSMYSYGLACKSGRGVAKSIPLAVYWLTRAVDEGYEPAKARLEKLLQEERNAL